jgi:aromatic-L-amino-acid/L-tryptophan decarboxylase
MAMRHLGVDGYRATIDREIALAGTLASQLRGRAGFEVCEPQSLSIVCFRCVRDDVRGDGERLNAFNKAVLEEVQLGGRAFLSSTVIDGVFWLRACVVNPRTTGADLAALVDAVATAAASRAR